MTAVYAGDVGTEIVLDCGADVSLATVREIVVRKPGGSSVTWSAVAEGTTSIKYTTQSGDLDIPGNWLLQAKVNIPNWSGKGKTTTLEVLDAFTSGS